MPRRSAFGRCKKSQSRLNDALNITSFNAMQHTLEHSSLIQTQRAHKLAVLVYLLYLFGVLFGVTALIGVIINHTHIQRTRETHAHSHFIWQIVSFWILFAGVVTFILLWPGVYGKWLAILCLLWWMASALTGIYYLVQNKPIPFVETSGRR